MCSTSNVNEALQGMTGSGMSGSPIPSVSAPRVQQNRSNYFVVDIREPKEIQETPLPLLEADAQVTLGAICHDASELIRQVGENSKTMVLICNTGERAQLAARSILQQQSGAAVVVLQRGIVGLENTAGLTPEFLVVLGLGDSTEKLSLALAAVAAATDRYQTVVLVLMSDGVNWFLKKDSAVESVVQGEPFKPCKAMLNKFLTKGGVVLACTTCVKHRGYSFEKNDMMDCVKPLQMPDLVRMLGEVKGGCLQFM